MANISRYTIGNEIEIFRELDIDNRYLVSTKGYVLSRCNGKKKMLKNSMSNTEYYVVNIKKQPRLIHRLVANAFIENKENKPQINHKNGIKADNRIQNLEWATHKENTQHAWAIGLSNYTEKMRVAVIKRNKNMSEEWRRNVINVLLERNKNRTKEWKEKQKKAVSKKVINKLSGEIYNSAKEASKLCNIPYSTLSRKLSNNRFNDTNLIYG